MGKLSHIDDIEKQQGNQELEPQHAQQPTQAHEQRTAPAPTDAPMTAEQEEDFHGLNTEEPMGIGHKSLIAIAIVVVIVAVLYIVNSWIHFV